MGQVIAGMTISLDGYVSDANGDVGPLYADWEAVHASPSMTETIASTGAVVMGRRSFAMGDPDSYVGQYEFQVPIFVVTTQPPAAAPKQDDRLTFTFVGDGPAAAIAQARAAAGERDVQVVGGPTLIRALLRAGLVDELHLDVMPVCLGGGLPFFAPDEPWAGQFVTLAASTEGAGGRISLRLRPIR